MATPILPDYPKDDAPPRPTPLQSLHHALGGRMVAFSGFLLPVQYEGRGILVEHAQCRERAALFDVSHMGQAQLSGPGAEAAFERLVTADVAALPPGRQRYSLMLNQAGGILDDVMITRAGDGAISMVFNASRRVADTRHVAAALPEGAAITLDDDAALLALQGPQAAGVLTRLFAPAATMRFLDVSEATIAGLPVRLSRSGYTGEDGFEIACSASNAEALARALLAEPEVEPAGLGARDSLRLEAGLCLFGNDIDELTTPIEAGLQFAIGKRRRQAWDMPGGVALRDQVERGPTRVRVGIRPEGRALARAGTRIAAMDGTEAGTVTSGGFSPTLKAPIAMGYVRRDLAALDTELLLLVRGQPLAARVVRLPFVPHRIFR